MLHIYRPKVVLSSNSCVTYSIKKHTVSFACLEVSWIWSRNLHLSGSSLDYGKLFYMWALCIVGGLSFVALCIIRWSLWPLFGGKWSVFKGKFHPRTTCGEKQSCLQDLNSYSLLACCHLAFYFCLKESWYICTGIVKVLCVMEWE